MTCSCYAIADNQHVLHPVLCMAHQLEHRDILTALYNSPPKYQQYFETEQDANDRARIIRDRYPSEGYGTTVNVYPVSRWFLVRADWGSAD